MDFAEYGYLKRVSHSVKQCKQLLEGWAERQLQESGKLLDGDASSFTGAGHGRKALQLLPQVVPLQTRGGSRGASVTVNVPTQSH